MIATCSCW